MEKFKITRINDNKTFEVDSYRFIDFDENGRGKKLKKKPKIGRALILPPYNYFYSWLTSEITEVITNYNFKTKNSTYDITRM